jgi:hypothetical protein
MILLQLISLVTGCVNIWSIDPAACLDTKSGRALNRELIIAVCELHAIDTHGDALLMLNAQQKVGGCEGGTCVLCNVCKKHTQDDFCI